MTSAQRILLLVVALVIGCGGPSTAPQVASRSDSSANQEVTTASEPASTSDSASNSESNRESAPAPATTTPREVAPRYTVRKAVTPRAAPSIPRVLLSEGHAQLCSVQVGESFPAVSLPKLGGGQTELASMLGSQATVVLFWHPDRWMARTALIDMQRDVADQFPAEQVAVVGIAVRQPMGAVKASLNKAEASFPQLIDTASEAFDTVGTSALPRIYVLDPQGKIVWFDIEYSEGTRRELWQTLGVLTK